MVPIILPKSGALEMGGAGHGPGMGSPRDDVDDDGGRVQSLFEPNTANRPRSKIAISRSWRATTTGHATGAMRLFCKDLRVGVLFGFFCCVG